MSPPIYTPDGSEVSEIVLPDGSTASQVIGPDGNVVFEAGSDIPDSGVARWTFDDADTSGSTAIDVWGANDGTITGATTGATGANQTYNTNEAYDFDGTDDHVTAPLPLSGSVDVSLSFWLNTGSTTGTRGIVQMGTGDSNNESAFGVIIINGTYQIAGFGGSFDFDTDISTSTNSWEFITATYNSSTDAVTFYVDGVQQASTTLGYTINSSGDTQIGREIDNSDNYDGSLDDIRVYSKELTSTQVSDLYNTGSISG